MGEYKLIIGGDFNARVGDKNQICDEVNFCNSPLYTIAETRVIKL